ncbi:poly-gamma-glutamate synthase PgsB [Pseudarthrobacter polychromogenes]|uniref:Poly-gamma-glutamate synthase PgsB n=1 Tax=Pseudarthrobacter polychromogenes TaxID=1676 RepID=A0ABQ1Y314_9MICC|nr:poly-gamma-glutamate synthase PgsB [Pseudarthrobacter polychromogenes]GGH10937.1 poly-gamma-glutamate synthase PgsB [Pseudarthrobacter polychromogenes]
MSASEVGLLVLAAVTLALIIYWKYTASVHHRRLEQLDVRIHVNGIRGKSSVTRLVAGVLREGGFITVAKTTGSAARVIGTTGEETPIRRLGAATIIEQVDIVRDHVRHGVEALVIECMAVRPQYQQYAQDYMVRSDITIITNVREDHQEEMGETLEEIADSMARTIPSNGVLITAEDRDGIRERLRRTAEERGSSTLYADASIVRDEDMRGFGHIEFKSNVAVGLAVAEYLGISRDKAITGMWKTVPDVGVVRLKTYDVLGKKITWVPMFAANDRESVILALKQLQTTHAESSSVIGILNNRQDRGRRAELFGAMVPNDLSGYLDKVVTMGAYEDAVTSMMTAGGFPRERILNLGDTVRPSLDQMLEAIAGLVEGDHGVLIGMVNIHTEQAEMLIHYFSECDGDDGVDELAASREPHRAPLAMLRLRAAQHAIASAAPRSRNVA